jgi:hypothetical protein
MEQKKKRMAAALAAVTAYIKSEEESLMMAAPVSQPGLAPVGATPVETIIIRDMNPWGTSGRQAQMQIRSLMQMKSFHGAKTR